MELVPPAMRDRAAAVVAAGAAVRRAAGAAADERRITAARARNAEAAAASTLGDAVDLVLRRWRRDGGGPADNDEEASSVVAVWKQHAAAIAAARPGGPAAPAEADAAVETFRAALEALEAGMPAGWTCPWQLRYCAERDPDAADAPVEFGAGAALVDADGVGVFEDRCCACGRTIQDGMEYGVGVPRVHCLDCGAPSAGTVCMECDGPLRRWYESHAPAAVDPAAATTARDAVQAALLRIHPHLAHRTVVETAHPVVMRESIFRVAGTATGLAQALALAFETYAARPCFGAIVATTGSAPHATRSVQYRSYAEEYADIRRYARALGTAGVQPQERVAISVHDARQWYQLEMAVILRRAVATVASPLWTPADWVATLARAGVCAVFVDAVLFAAVCPGGSAEPLRDAIPTLRTVVVVGGSPAAAVGVLSLEAFAAGAEHVSDQAESGGGDRSHHDDDDAFVLHTSGSTGGPKGLVMSAAQALRDFDQASFERPLVEMSYLPPVWATNKLQVWQTIFNGGAVAFVNGPLTAVLEATAVVAPTQLVLMPTVAQALYAEYEAVVSRSLRDASAASLAGARAVAAAHVRALVGARCRYVALGGARTPPALLEFLRETLPCRIIDAYGSSESGGIANNGRIVAGVAARLLDRPDLGYSLHDLPLPRGEICVKSHHQIPLDRWICADSERAALRERYLPDGYFRTGDLGALTPDGDLVVLGRATATVKLASGQFVSTDKVEMALAGLPGVTHLAVLPDNDGTGLVAVVVVVVVPQASGGNGHAAAATTPQHWLAVKIHERGRSAGLAAHEIPYEVVVDAGPWTPENGCLLPNFKVNRPAVHARHRASLAAATAMMATTMTTIETARAEAAHDEVVRVVADVLGCAPDAVALDVPLVEQGAHSLGLLRLIVWFAARSASTGWARRLSLAEAAAATPADLTDALSGVRTQPGRRDLASPSWDATSIGQEIDRHLQRLQAQAGLTVAAPAQAGPGVLVTGATGFFGRFLVAALLQLGAPLVVCLVRALDPVRALGRVREALVRSHAMADVDVDAAIAAGRLVCVVGDVTLRRCGLDADSEAFVVRHVCTVVHAAAVVKFYDAAHGYDLLRPCNVDGTVEVLALALAARAHVVHLSTTSVGVAGCVSEDGRTLVDLGAPSAAATSPAAVDAYTLTKAVAEVIVHRAAPEAAVVRLPLLTWSAAGAANEDDWLVRLLRTCDLLGIRPQCDLVPEWAAPVPYLPVDVAAEALADLAHEGRRAGAHVLRPRHLSVAALVDAATASQHWHSLPDQAWLHAVRASMSLPFAPLAARFLDEAALRRDRGTSLGRSVDTVGSFGSSESVLPVPLIPTSAPLLPS